MPTYAGFIIFYENINVCPCRYYHILYRKVVFPASFPSPGAKKAIVTCLTINIFMRVTRNIKQIYENEE